MKNCIFCESIKDFYKIFETKNFLIILDKFPIIPLHILIISKQHDSCLGEIDNIDNIEELILIKSFIKSKFNNMCFYEHGKTGNCAILLDSKCEHFHLHCLPLDICIHNELEYYYNFLELKSLKEIYKYYNENGNYLFFENHKQEKKFYIEGDTITPSSFIRGLICNKLNLLNRSNWQHYKNNNIFDESKNLIKKINFNNFNEFIF
ncbi:MAG: HIT domain-containing protein [Rickettsiales bacterium]